MRYRPTFSWMATPVTIPLLPLTAHLLKNTLEKILREAVESLQADKLLPPELPEEATVTRTRDKQHGDFTSNIAMTAAKAAGLPPRELAQRIRERLGVHGGIEKTQIAGPGFINFFLQPAANHAVVASILEAGDRYGRGQFGAGRKVQIEFVSANPTGPIHVGNGWFASYGDALGRVMARCGYSVHREYYVNDTGGQIRTLGASLLAHAHGRPIPERGYPGTYVATLAETYDGPDDVTAAGRWAAERILAGIRDTMATIHVVYDEWYSQASIEESDAVAETIAELAAKGLVEEEGGATWLRTADFGDPRERRVLRKADGDYTYLAGDIAYHRDKFMVRGFDRVIDVWGADHHGQVASLRAGVQALGVAGDRLEVRLGQMVSLTSGKMSKRSGNVVDLDELVTELGPDVTRLLSLLTSIDQSVTIDLDKVRSTSRESPVFYVQYAHARIASIGRVAAERGVTRGALSAVDLGLLVHERELEVLRSLSELDDIVRIACTDRAPHKVATWVRELADRFHGFYHDCYVMGDDVPPALTQARLWLVEGARTGLAIGLGLLGVSAPDSM